jgi:hypothetical protein
MLGLIKSLLGLTRRDKSPKAEPAGISRRGFLRGLAAMGAGVALAPVLKHFALPEPVVKWVPLSLRDADKERIIAEALSSEEGRIALARAMVEPIRRALEYQAVGRKCLLVEELSPGAMARYERDAESVKYVIGKRGVVPQSIVDGEEVYASADVIDSNHSISVSDVANRQFRRLHRKLNEVDYTAELSPINSDNFQKQVIDPLLGAVS